MGVRGLTTFIANRSDAYLHKYRLHDTNLVIDGNSLAASLYQKNRTRNDCFGGDYDKYENTICKFFDALLQCNITPLIVLDGGYEKKKLRTVFVRLKNKVKMFQRLNCVNQSYHSVFPLFVRELFVEVVLKLGIQVVRCDFEADYELACLARTLNCPILSYDSDFFVYDVLYIPYVTLTVTPTRSDEGLYLPCQLYKIEYFLKAYGGLDKSIVPLLAVLLGNDYINKSVFKDFYATLRLTKKKKQQNAAQRSISSIMKWLQNETYESAIAKILSKIPQNKRRKIANSIKLVVEGYVCKKSNLLKHLHLSLDNEKIDFFIDTEKCLKESEDVDELQLDLQKSVLEDDDNDDDDSVENSSSSEEEVSDLESDLKEEYDDSIPEWFIKNFRHCLYPTAFMDILVRNTYFCTPQLENYVNICSHKICIKIIAAINKILHHDVEKPTLYVMRHEISSLKKYETPACDLELPSLHNLRNLSQKCARVYLFEILQLEGSFTEVIAKVPEDWQLYILSIMYWIKNATPSANYSHVYSIVLCMLMVNKIGPQANMFNYVLKFITKHKLNAKYLQKKKPPSVLLRNITKEDCIKCFNDLSKFFQMEKNMRQSAKSYDRNILDCFAQFQSSLLHIKYLNVLLNNPFTNCMVSEFYNGTFLYNMCYNLEKRTSVDAYMDTLLRPYPTILKCFRTIMSMLITVTPVNVCNVENKRRRKKRKATKSLSSDDAYKTEEVKVEDDVVVMDKNNRFSLLNFV